MAEFKNVGVGWSKRGNKGEFISLKLTRANGESCNINLFPNKNKQKDIHPDWTATMEVSVAEALGLQLDERSQNQSRNRVSKQPRGNSYNSTRTQSDAPAPSAAGDDGEPF